MSTSVDLRKELNAIANHLWNNGYEGKVMFDHKSYDDELDIPHLFIGGRRVLVDTFEINKDASKVTIISGDDKYSVDTNYLINEMDDKIGERCGMFGLLRDVYYDTKESWDIGDYELDFIEEEG